MSTHLSAARHHAEKIEHFYKHGGTLGYKQALHHLQQLETLVVKSNRAKKDAGAIQAILDGVRPKLDEMKKLSEGDTQ